MMRLRSAGLLLIVTAVAASCSPQQAPVGSEYLARLARVLEQPLPVETELQTVPFPDKRALRQPILSQTVDWAEFARLHRCDLGELLGYRNSGLGKVMQPLARLDYELRLLRLGGRCQQAFMERAEEGDTAELLSRVLQQKRADLATVFWNAVIAGDDWQRWMGRSTVTAAGDPSAALNALRQQALALEGLAAQPDQVGIALQVLAGSERVGQAQQQWRRTRVLLQSASQLLEEHSARLCRNGQPTPAAERLKKVFRRFYVQQLQAPMARAVHADAEWVSALVAFVAALPQSSEGGQGAFNSWYLQVIDPDRAQSSWSRTRAAFQAHAGAWQAFADRCGLNLFRDG